MDCETNGNEFDGSYQQYYAIDSTKEYRNDHSQDDNEMTAVESVITDEEADTYSKNIDVKVDNLVVKVNSRSKNRNKTVECRVCLRVMKSDKLKRHMKTHRDIFHLDDDEVRSEIKRRKKIYETNEERIQYVKKIADEEGYDFNNIDKDKKNLRESMLQDNKDYLETIDMGKQINEIIDEGVVHEESLVKYRKDALKLYLKQRPTRDMTQVELRPWQQELSKILSIPSDREVVWVQGIKGNEGKTWYQDHIATLYGHARVVRLDLKLNSRNVLHVLSKRPLSTTDIFLFNERRAMNNETCNYTILESIKDGLAVSSKYNSDLLHFKVPNTVVVFSNRVPNTKELSKDRWKIFRITKDDLKDVTIDIWKMQHNR